jgi:hypothetical protein
MKQTEETRVTEMKDPGMRIPDKGIPFETCPWCAGPPSVETTLRDADTRQWHVRCVRTACALLPSKVLADFDLLDWVRTGRAILAKLPEASRAAVIDRLTEDVFEEGEDGPLKA